MPGKRQVKFRCTLESLRKGSGKGLLKVKGRSDDGQMIVRWSVEVQVKFR